MWACSPLLRRQRYGTQSEGEGDNCRDHTSSMLARAETLPPVPLLLWGRVCLALSWLAFAVSMLRRGKVPIGPGSHTIAVPSRGLAGPWQRPSPLAFGGAGDPQAHRACPLGTRVSCVAPVHNARALRNLMARARTDAPRPTLAARVVISKGGWVMRPRYEPEMYTPVGATSGP